MLDFLRFQSVRGTVKDRVSGEERTLDPYSWDKRSEAENP